jgi:hypothetical protein
MVECLFIEAPFHRNGFSLNGLFIECKIISNFQNCKQNFCSTSASKVIDDLVGVNSRRNETAKILHNLAFHLAKGLYWHPILT